MVEQNDFSKISCVADANVAPFVDKALKDLEIPELYIQHTKQMTLADKFSLLGFHSRTVLEETRAAFYRFYLPSVYETGAMRRIAEAADLYLPGRGSIYAKSVKLNRKTALEFDTAKLDALCGQAVRGEDNYMVVYCIVPRGQGDAIASTVLEMGLCVPLISFGYGKGIRDKLGLLRVTIPVENEVIYCIVPRVDAELLESVIVHKARLDLPGQGFLYKTAIRACTVNLRVRRSKRQYAASMEQVIATLDTMSGSSDWRRMGTTQTGEDPKIREDAVCISLIGDEATLDAYGKAAMDCGIAGATFIPLTFRSYQAEAEHARNSAREICDLVVSSALMPRVTEAVSATGLFEDAGSAFLELSSADTPLAGKTGSEGKKKETVGGGLPFIQRWLSNGNDAEVERESGRV
jgi:hypothetical protein